MTQGQDTHSTAARDRIPWIVLIAYGLGGVVPIALFNSVGQLSGLILNVGLGVSAVLVGVAQMAPRFWDAFTDPIMGHISDNTRSRWGRRRPYIVIGGILVALSFVALWSVPREWSQLAQFWYFLVAMLVFYTAVTMFEVPHGALGMEMTDDYHERTRLFSAKSFVGNVGAIVTAWFYFLANTDLFRGEGGTEVDGMRNVAYLAAVLLLVPAFACAWFCKEGKLTQARTQERVSLRESLGQTARNRSFLVLVGIVFATVMGFHLVNNLANYIAIFYLFGGNKEAASHLLAINGTIWSVTSLVAIFPLVWLSKRMGKSWTLTLAVLLMGGAQALKIVCYNPALPQLTYIPTAMLAAGMLMFFTLASAMVADVCDADELATGTRSEGAYYAVFWWFMKMGMGVAALVNGFIIAVTGFDEKIGLQSDRTLLLLRVFEIGLPIALCSASVLLIRRYPLTEARAYEIKRQLEARRPAATAAEAPPA